MIITRTPFRISFFGGGTDYPVWYRENGGAVLATTINRFCYISLRHLPLFFDYRHRIVYSKTEFVKELEKIKHPSVRECFKYTNVTDGLELHHDGDLPARTGLGTSSSFTVGLLKALFALQGKMVSKRELALAAIHVEQNMIRENVGSQDQTLAAYGGLNLVKFSGDASNHIIVEPLSLSKKRITELENHLMLFFTGFSRNASELAGHQIKATPKKKAELKAIRTLVDEAAKILCSQGDLKEFGTLLNKTWMLKRKLTEHITTKPIDDIYDTAIKAGAIGGKLLGAGGGGFILFFIAPEKRAKVKKALNLLHVPFQIEWQGSQVIFYDPD